MPGGPHRPRSWPLRGQDPLRSDAHAGMRNWHAGDVEIMWRPAKLVVDPHAGGSMPRLWLRDL